MKNSRLNDIINGTRNYLENIQRFHGDKVYIDDRRVIMEEGKKSIDHGPEIMRAETAKDSNGYVETDLFGNEIARKEDWEFSRNLDELYSATCECQKCVLGQTRTNYVFGVGDKNADIVLIGEAPGADEDAQGEPFVGRAGQLLNKILDASGFRREDVYICNILKCRPPGNRNPQPDEIQSCVPYLDLQLKLMNPKILLLLGKVAADALLNLRLPLNKMRGKVHNYKGFKTMVTFHPAALLRNPQWKRPTWEDMKEFKKIYEQL